MRGKDAIAFPVTWEAENSLLLNELSAVCALLPGSTVLLRLCEGALPETAKEERLHQKWWVGLVEKTTAGDSSEQGYGMEGMSSHAVLPARGCTPSPPTPPRRSVLSFQRRFFGPYRNSGWESPWKKCRKAPRLAVFAVVPRMSMAIIHSVVKKTEFYSRHQAVVEFVSKYIRAAGIKVHNDVPFGGKVYV